MAVCFAPAIGEVQLESLAKLSAKMRAGGVFSVFLFGLLSLVFSAAAGGVNYADVRFRAAVAMEERTHEVMAALAALQDVSRGTATAIDRIKARCGSEPQSA